MNDALISVWILAEKDGTVRSAHCLGCKAGLSESCSHVASVLFYVEAWTRIWGQLPCTQVKCSSLLTSLVKDIPYARMRDINLAPARKLKADLDNTIDSLCENSEAQATFFTGSRRELTVEVPTEAEMETFCRSLDRSKIKPVALSLTYLLWSVCIRKQQYLNNPRPFWQWKFKSVLHWSIKEVLWCRNFFVKWRDFTNWKRYTKPGKWVSIFSTQSG